MSLRCLEDKHDVAEKSQRYPATSRQYDCHVVSRRSTRCCRDKFASLKLVSATAVIGSLEKVSEKSSLSDRHWKGLDVEISISTLTKTYIFTWPTAKRFQSSQNMDTRSFSFIISHITPYLPFFV